MIQPICIRSIVSSVLLLAGLTAASSISATIIQYGPGDNLYAWKEEKQTYDDLSVTPNIKGVGGAGRYPIGTTIITNNGNTRLDWANRTYAEAGSALHQTPLHQIRGNLSKNNDNYNDVDLFEIWIEDPSVFKAYTAQTNNETRVTNPQLFLFDGDGYGIYASDNAPFNSGLPFSQAIIDASVVDTLTNPGLFGSLTAGVYLIGISRHDVYPRYEDPVTGNNRRIFNPNNRYHMFVKSQADPNGVVLPITWYPIGQVTYP